MNLLFLFLSLLVTNDYPKSVTKNGMMVEWFFVDESHLQFKLVTPTTGWSAIGINTQNSLVGSNLIMGAVTDGTAVLSDRYVLALGDHKAVTDLGISSSVQLEGAAETATGTVIEFTLKAKSTDDYHHTLQVNDTIYLTLAYSQEDDFQHHSSMRTALSIIL